MAQTTTNYGLLKPESTDSYNHMIYDNPNMDTIDAAMKANADSGVTSASCIKSGTTHTITRSNTSANVFRFTATGDWITGDTMIVDGVTVSPYLSTGEALTTGAFIINTEVLASISGTRVTVYSNKSAESAALVSFDDTNVLFTASNVQDAIEASSDAQYVKYSGSQSVKGKIDTMEIWIRTLTDSTGVTVGANSYQDLDIDVTSAGWTPACLGGWQLGGGARVAITYCALISATTVRIRFNNYTSSNITVNDVTLKVLYRRTV